MEPFRESPSLLPAPRSWRPTPGRLDPAVLTHLRVDGGDAELVRLARRAAADLGPILGRVLPVLVHAGEGFREGPVSLDLAPGPDPAAYRLEIVPDRATVSGAGCAGLVHGVQSLRQLLAAGTTGGVPCGVISDAPRFPWRGLLLDSARHFQPVDDVLRVLDLLALHRLNVLHWHLTEDQGWRLEIPGLPRLTEVGAWRTGPEGRVHGGFYTAADVRRVVAHAADRAITVVPEIELPGHCQAALAAYPELSCNGGPFSVQTQWGVHPDVYCAGREETFAFLESVLDHVLELFPGPFVHIGGDECPKERWRACPRCRERMRSEGLADAGELQSWFIARIGRFLEGRGRRLIGWDEILEGGLPPGATVHSWRGTAGAVAAARAGHDTVVSPTSHAYFDYDVGVLDLQRVLEFAPVPAELDPVAARRILGGQANLWTEYAPADRVVERLLPRLCAMSERLWGAAAEDDFAAFRHRLAGHRDLLARLGFAWGSEARPLSVAARPLPEGGGHEIAFSLAPHVERALAAEGLEIRTWEVPVAAVPGYRPDLPPEDWAPPPPPDAARWDGPAAVPPPPQPVLHCGRLLVGGTPYGAPAAVERVAHAGLGARLEAPDGAFPQAARLLDGLRGGPLAGDERWAEGPVGDWTVLVTLPAPVPLLRLEIRFLQDANARAFLPRSVEFSVATTDGPWRTFRPLEHDLDDRVQDRRIHAFGLDLDGAAVGRVRLVARQGGGCPAWHPAAGEARRLLADELVCLARAGDGSAHR